MLKNDLFYTKNEYFSIHLLLQNISHCFRVNYTSPGQCLYRPYLGVAYRDKSYDGYMNSQECLFGPGSEFLAQYDTLLR